MDVAWAQISRFTSVQSRRRSADSSSSLMRCWSFRTPRALTWQRLVVVGATDNARATPGGSAEAPRPGVEHDMRSGRGAMNPISGPNYTGNAPSRAGAVSVVTDAWRESCRAWDARWAEPRSEEKDRRFLHHPASWTAVRLFAPRTRNGFPRASPSAARRARAGRCRSSGASHAPVSSDNRQR
jgi:hypothetical protein